MFYYCKIIFLDQGTGKGTGLMYGGVNNGDGAYGSVLSNGSIITNANHQGNRSNMPVIYNNC